MVARVTPVRGPTIKPTSPPTLSKDVTVVGVKPTAATRGITTGAIIAFPPAKVPSSPHIIMELI